MLVFKNSKNEEYFIKSKLTKKGNETYFMTRKGSDDCLNAIPTGFEVFEKYDAQTMYIRRAKKKEFTDAEVKIIETELIKNQNVVDFRLDLVGKLIKIYTIEIEGDFSSNDSQDKPTRTKSRGALNNNLLSSYSVYRRFDERMRISLIKEKDYRAFEFQRYCYRGSIDDWTFIDGGSDLADLAEINLVHLGKESYYDLQ